MKVNYLLLCFFLFLIHSINCDYKILDTDKFYKEQKGIKKGLNYYNQVLDDLKKILEYYVYIDVLKSPPQPNDLPNYNPKVDTMKEIEKIRSNLTNETNYYDFFRKITLLVGSYKDAHMSYGLRGYSFNYVFFSPIQLRTVQPKKGLPYMTASAINEDYFKNATEIFEIIKANEGQSIHTINGQSPFDFIQNFGGEFFNLKNPQANYAFKTHNYMAPFFAYFPFDEDEIKIEVKYENGAHFETEYAITQKVSGERSLCENDNLYRFFDDINIEHEFMNYIDNYFENNNYGVPKGLNELLNDFQKYKNINNNNNLLYKNKNEFNYENFLTESENEVPNIEWDIEYDTGKSKTFQCRVDKPNELNVIHMPTFDFNDYDLIIQKIKQCVELFDTNKYNIVIILNFNGGGIELVAQTLVEYIQPYITSRFYSTFRKGEYLDRYYDMGFEDNSVVETCKVPDKNYVIANTIHLDYGEGVINNVTEPLRRFGQYREQFNEEKKKLKNKRKPTEILIFTDGYSASSASLFTKSLQNEGGAIIVGYNGHPLNATVFDGSQHFSTVFNYNDLNSLEPELMDRMIDNKIYFTQICRTSNFFNYTDPKVPEEFNIKAVDEVANIYEAYKENDNYQLFMNKSKEIFDKYNNKNECNKNNTRLTLLDENCNFSDDKFAHGGHPCNSQGHWDLNKCIKVYCDEGYLLDYKRNKCVKEPCLPNDDTSFSFNIRINQIMLSLLFIVLIFN